VAAGSWETEAWTSGKYSFNDSEDFSAQECSWAGSTHSEPLYEFDRQNLILWLHSDWI